MLCAVNTVDTTLTIIYREYPNELLSVSKVLENVPVTI